MKLKKWGGLLLTCVLSVSLAAGCGPNNPGGSKEGETPGETAANLNQTGFPIVNEPITVTGFAGKFFANADWNNIKLWKEYEKTTNIKVQWDTVHKDNLAENGICSSPAAIIRKCSTLRRSRGQTC